MDDNLPRIRMAIVFEPHLKFGRCHKWLGTFLSFPHYFFTHKSISIHSSSHPLPTVVISHVYPGWHTTALCVSSMIQKIRFISVSVHMCWESLSLEALIWEWPRPYVVAFMEKGRWETRWDNRVAVMKRSLYCVFSCLPSARYDFYSWFWPHQTYSILIPINCLEMCFSSLWKLWAWAEIHKAITKN